MLFINFICYHYWLQSQQAIHNYETILSQINALKLLADNHTNKIKLLQEIDLEAKEVKYEDFKPYHPFTNELNSYPKNFNIEWMEKVEENFTMTVNTILEASDKCHTQLMLAETERNFTTTDLKLQVEHQLNLITKLNQSMLTTTNSLKKIEETFATKVNLKSEITNQISKLNQSILNEMRQQLIEIKENFNTSVVINISVVNDQLKSMLNDSEQWLKWLTEVNETFTKNITAFGSELHALKLTHSNIVMDEEKQCSPAVDSIFEHQNVVELKLLEQSTEFMLAQ